MSATERQMAADAIALSKEHADRADAAEARWAVLKDYLTQQINQDAAVADSGYDGGPVARARSAAHYTLVSANRSTLAMMRELEKQP